MLGLDELLTPKPTAEQTRRSELPAPTYPQGVKVPYLGYFSQDDQPYDLTDYPEVRKRTLANVEAAVKTRFPLESDKYILTVDNLHYVDKDYKPSDEKYALLNGKTLGTRLKGDWVLYDKATGKELERKSNNTLVNVPYLTNRGVFIRSGNEYGLKNTFRLRPGLYTRIKGDGIIATHVNPAQGTGRQANIMLNPTNGVFTWKMGTRNYGLLPLLMAAGKTEEELRAAWGDELFDNNFKKYEGIITGRSKAEAKEYNELWHDKLSKYILDEDTTSSTLGTPYKQLNGDAILAATNKILRVAQTYSDDETDERDSLRYQTIMGAADYLPERIVRDGGGLFRKVLNKIDKEGTLASVPSGVFQPHVDAVFQEDRHAGYIDGASPVEALDFTTAVSRVGEGGLGTERAASDESRGVNNSYLGFIDSIRCYAEDTELMTHRGWKKVQDITMNDELACLINGRLEYHKPINLHSYNYRGTMYGYAGSHITYLVTPNHRMWSRCYGLLRGGRTAHYLTKRADQMHGQNRVVNAADFLPLLQNEEQTIFDLPTVTADLKTPQIYGNPPQGANLHNIERLDIKDFAAFLGWYLAEGSFYINKEIGRYCVEISQDPRVNPANYTEIKELIERLPFNTHYRVIDENPYKKFYISRKQLVMYLAQFGHCEDKFIPDWVFSAPLAARYAFRDAILKGDGRDQRHLCTMSRRLAEDFARLQFELGESVKLVHEPEKRYKDHPGIWVVYWHTRRERLLAGRTKRHPRGEYYTEEYNGKVYCPTVPGGLVYCRRSEKSVGFWCHNSPESQAVGLQVYMTHGVKKDSTGQLWTKMIPRVGDGRPVYVSMKQASQSNVATPEYYDPQGDPEEIIPAFRQGRDLEYMPRKDVDFYVADSSNMMSDNTGFIPGIGGLRSNRTMLGSKASSQAMSLPHREAPLVRRYLRNEDGTDGTTESYMGRKMGAKFADTAGVITDVTDDEIVYRDDKGKKHVVDLYNQLPANNKGWLTNTPQVKVGDVVKPGQILASSNYTDDEGNAALGVNLRVAMVSAPDAGSAFDAIAVSESAAKTKLASEQLYKTKSPVDNETVYDKNRFLKSFDTSEFTKEQLDTIGDDGIVMPGTELHKGDPMVLAIGLREPGIKGVSKHADTPIVKTWEHDYPGTVMDVGRTNKAVSIYTQALTPARVGDKLSAIFGNKGVIGKIIPDEEMLQDENGQPFEVYQSPLGIPSRVNPMVLGALQLGKIAKHTGKPVVWKDFSPEPMADTVLRMLDENGLKESENLFDPNTGKTVPDVATGYLHYLKFKHMGDVKEKSRGTGDYTMEDLPLKGGDDSARRFGSMEIGALFGHAGLQSEVMKDAKLVRGQANHEFWRAVRNGEAVPTPSTPLVHRKFFEHLRAAGVTLEDRGDRIHMFAATEPDVERLTQNREVKSGATYDAKELRPIQGGLFDPQTFGANGDQWAYYQLPEPVLNPLMEKAVVSILGWKDRELQGVLNGEQEVNGKTGPDAVKDILGKLDLEKEYHKAKVQLKSESLPALKRDKILKRYRAIASLLREGKNPQDLLLSRIPILPPKYRPISVMGNDVGIVSDANYLYKAMIDASEDFRDAKDQLPDEMLLDARKNLHTAIKAVVGLTDSPDKKLQEKGVEGVLKWAFGKGSPKFGSLHRKVFGATVDLGGLAVAAPDSKLGIDEIGLPERSAWSAFEPFVVRNLRQRGYPLSQAMKAVQEREPIAKQALEEELSKRPVLVNRAPTLHKYNIMAFWPRLIRGNTLRYNPLVAKDYAVDADGDLMSFHVPVSRKAVNEAVERMLPSKNLLSASTLKARMVPVEEFAQGLYIASRAPKGKPIKFASKEAMLQALNAGKITYDTPVEFPN